MLTAAAKAAPLFFATFRFWEGVSALGVAWIGSYFKWFRPLLKERREHDARKERERQAVYGFVLGIPADGLRPEVLAAPVQMKHLTDTVDGMVVKVDEAKASNEAVVKGQRILTDQVTGFQNSLGELDTKMSEVLEGTAALVHESKTNQGGSMRDVVDAQGVAIGEIQTEQTRVREEKATDDA